MAITSADNDGFRHPFRPNGRITKWELHPYLAHLNYHPKNEHYLVILPPMETITLFQLCLYPKEPMSFAPHVWKTLLPLRLLNVPFKTELVTLTQLREELPARLGLASVTVPVSAVTLLVHGN